MLTIFKEGFMRKAIIVLVMLLVAMSVIGESRLHGNSSRSWVTVLDESNVSMIMKLGGMRDGHSIYYKGVILLSYSDPDILPRTPVPFIKLNIAWRVDRSSKFIFRIMEAELVDTELAQANHGNWDRVISNFYGSNFMVFNSQGRTVLSMADYVFLLINR